MRNPGISYQSFGNIQSIVDRNIIKASLMGILDDLDNKKTRKAKKKKRWP